jgi:hypothetical protein
LRPIVTLKGNLLHLSLYLLLRIYKNEERVKKDGTKKSRISVNQSSTPVFTINKIKAVRKDRAPVAKKNSI